MQDGDHLDLEITDVAHGGVFIARHDGRVVFVEGASSPYTPRTPDVPPGLLSLATIYQWWDDRTRVVMDVVKVTVDPTTAQATIKNLITAQEIKDDLQQKTDAVRTGSPEVIAAMGDFYDSLNPAQQQQVRDFMQKRRGWRRGG